jgi:hypothetical protein
VANPRRRYFVKERLAAFLTLQPNLRSCQLVFQSLTSRVVIHAEQQPRIQAFRSRDTASLSPGERMARFVALQRSALALLSSSPQGYREFWARNLRQRRVHASD